MTDNRPKTFGQLAAHEGLAHAPTPGQLPDRVTMWDIHEANHADAMLAGLCMVTLAEYRRRVADATAEFTRRGIPVVMVTATPRQILDTMQQHGLPRDPSGQAAAIGLLAPPVAASGQ